MDSSSLGWDYKPYGVHRFATATDAHLRDSQTPEQVLPYTLQHQGQLRNPWPRPSPVQSTISILLFHASLNGVRSSPSILGTIFKSTSIWSWTGSSLYVLLSSSSSGSFAVSGTASWLWHASSLQTSVEQRNWSRPSYWHVRAKKTFRPHETWKLHKRIPNVRGGTLTHEGFSILASIYISRVLPGGVTTTNAIFHVSWSVIGTAIYSFRTGYLHVATKCVLCLS